MKLGRTVSDSWESDSELEFDADEVADGSELGLFDSISDGPDDGFVVHEKEGVIDGVWIKKFVEGTMLGATFKPTLGISGANVSSLLSGVSSSGGATIKEDACVGLLVGWFVLATGVTSGLVMDEDGPVVP